MKKIYNALTFSMVFFFLAALNVQAGKTQLPNPTSLVSPDTLSVTVNSCNDSVTQNILVTNTGSGPLLFSLEQQSDFFEGFEDGLDKWIISGNFGVQDLGYNSDHSLSESPSGNYGNNWNMYATLRDSLRILNKDSARLTFDVQYALECNYDYLYVQLSVNNGSWVNLSVFNCYSGWVHVVKNLSSYVNNDDFIKIRFYFHSDYSVIADGTNIDNITIKGIGNMAEWMSMPVTAGYLLPGESLNLPVTFRSAGLVNGTYHNVIRVNTNDPVTPVVSIPVFFTVNGNPAAFLSTTSLSFGELMQHTTLTDTVTIENTGCGDLVVDSLYTGSPYFVVLTGPFTLKPGKTKQVLVEFEPDTLNHYEDGLYLLTNDALLDPQVPAVLLDGYGTGAPVISVDPQSFNVDLSCGESVTLPLIIYNNGLTDLYVKGTYEVMSDGLLLYYPMNSDASDASGNNFNGVNYSCAPASDRFNNPGYALYFDGNGAYIDVPDGVYFDGNYTVSAWINPSEIRNWSRLIDFANGPGDNNVLCAISMNTTGYFLNEVYNNSYSGGYVYCSDAPPLDTWTMVTAVLDGNYISIYINGELCTTSYTSQLPQNILRTQNFIGRSNWWGDSYYKGYMDDLRVYNRALDATEITDLYSTYTALWLSGEDINDTIHPGEGQAVSVTLDASGLNAGSYVAGISLHSNDPLQPQLVVPVSLNVTGIPQIEVPDTLVNFGNIMQNTTSQRNVMIKNTGCDTLFLLELNIDEPAFSLAPSFAPNFVLPHDSLQLTLVFFPQDTGVYNGMFTVINNDETLTIHLEGYADPAPVLGWDPDTLSLLFAHCDDSLTGVVTLYNNGLLDLEWTINTLDNAGNSISFDAPGQQVSIGNFGEMPEQGTIEFWQWTNALQNYNNSFCTNGFWSGANVGIRFEENVDGLYGVVFGNDYGNFYGFTVTNNLPVNSWHHVAATWDKANNTVSTYFDGEAVTVDAYCPTWATNWTDMMIGVGWADWRWWNGKIDECRIWTIKRSQDEIRNTMYRSLAGNENGLIAYWDFNENEGDTVHDRSNNGHTGTFSGASRETSGIPVSKILELSPLSGTIAPGDAATLNVKAWNTDMNAGVQLAWFGIYSNDPLNAAYYYPCKLETTGDPYLEAMDSLSFGDVMQYTSKTGNLLITNTGCDTLIITDVQQLNPVFSFDLLPLIILPKSTAELYVTFSGGGAVGYFDNTVLLVSNADPFSLNLTANCYAAPQIYIDPSYFELSLGCNDTVYQSIDITNNGQSQLIYSFNPLGNNGIGVLPPECTPQTSNYCCGIGVTQVVLAQIDLTTDPGGGYQDYSATEVALLRQGIPYTITVLTGSGYSENAVVWIDYNNNGSFDDSEKILSSFSTYYTHSGDFIVPDWCVLNVPLRMRVMSDYTFANMPDGCSDLYYGQTLDFSVIIRFAATLPEGIFSLEPGETATKEILLSGLDIEPGWYPSNFLVYSNDPVTPVVQVDYDLTVLGTPDPTLNSNVLDFGTVMQFTTDTAQLYLSNHGCDSLYIYNAYTNDEVFEVTEYPLVLAPGASQTIVVSFHPEVGGLYENYLYLETNGGNLEVQLLANVSLAPQIWLNVDWAEFFFWCSDSADFSIFFANDGPGDLVYTIVPDESSNSGILGNVTFNPPVDTIGPASGAIEVIIHATSSGLSKGQHTQYYNILSNDPFIPVIPFVVTINVDGSAAASVAPDCVHFGTTVQYTYTHDSVLITNTGCDSLFVWGISTESGNFYSNTQPFALPAYGSAWIDVTFNPQDQGDMTDNMHIYTNVGEPVVCLTGFCAPLPIISIDPVVLNMVLSCQQTGMMLLHITNQGQANLTVTSSLLAGSPWLACDAVIDTLVPDETIEVGVHFDRGSLANGLYTGEISFASNDPFNPVINIPAYLLIPNQLEPVQLPNDTGYCAGGSIAIHAGNFASYLWNDGSTAPYLTVASPGVYYVDVVDIHNCASSDTVVISEFEIPQVTVIPDTALCANGTILLNGTISGLLPTAPVSVKIGTGTAFSNDTGPNPFGTYYMDHKVQMLYKKQELLTAGLSPGNITSLGIVVGNAGEPGLSNLNIKIKSTTLGNLISFSTGMTQVYSTAYYHPHSGANLFSLQSPFYWDGNSNIIVEFCFDNNGWSYNSTYEYTSVSNAVFGNWCDNCAPGCALANGAAFSQRANLIVHGDGDFTQYSWTGPASYQSSHKSSIITNAQLPQDGWYVLLVDNGYGCTGSDSMLVTIHPSPQVNAGPDAALLQYDSVQLTGSVSGGVMPYNILWSPPAGLGHPSELQTKASPSSTTVYTLSVTGNNQCSASDQLQLTVTPRYSISGQVVYNNAYFTALPGVKVFLENQNSVIIDSVLTNEGGNYIFPRNVTGSYFVHAVSQQEPGGVNATDALQICRYITFLQSLGGLRLKAADVNASQTVTSADALFVLHKTVGNISTFPAGDWQFERKGFQVIGGNVYVDFYGISTGDVNGSFIPLAKVSSALSLEYAGEIYTAGNESFDLPVYLSEATDLGALTLVLHYPPDQLEITGVSSTFSDLLYTINEGTLRLGWNSIQGAHHNPSTPLLTLHVTRKGERLPEGFVRLYLGEESELADPAGTILAGKMLTIPVVKPKELSRQAFELSQNRPNPFSSTSEISFFLPERGSVELTIESLLGEPIQYYDLGSKAAGSHTMVIDCSGLANGMYVYRMNYQASGQKLNASRKLLISR